MCSVGGSGARAAASQGIGDARQGPQALCLRPPARRRRQACAHCHNRRRIGPGLLGSAPDGPCINPATAPSNRPRIASSMTLREVPPDNQKLWASASDQLFIQGVLMPPANGLGAILSEATPIPAPDRRRTDPGSSAAKGMASGAEEQASKVLGSVNPADLLAKPMSASDRERRR